MRIRQAVLATLLTTAAVFVSGCLAAAIGAGVIGVGTVAYIKGDLEVVETRDIDVVYEATRKAVRQLGLRMIKERKDPDSGLIVAHDADYKEIKITLKSTADGGTELSIRVGLFGDQATSVRIYQKIHDNLKRGWFSR
jgi:hypothetical protein